MYLIPPSSPPLLTFKLINLFLIVDCHHFYNLYLITFNNDRGRYYNGFYSYHSFTYKECKFKTKTRI